MLDFIQPKIKVSAENLVFPNTSVTRYGLLVSYEKLRELGKSQSMWRNIVALYLYTAQVPIQTIADFLTLSPSRVRSIIRLARKKLFVLPTGYLKKPVRSSVNTQYSSEEIAAHRFYADAEEMRAAEHALSGMHMINAECVCIISAALLLGRASYDKASINMQDKQCPCSICRRNNGT